MKHFAKGKEKNLCEAILGIRNVDKLLNTYIDKMPQIALDDGRVHASYNQYGAKTYFHAKKRTFCVGITSE